MTALTTTSDKTEHDSESSPPQPTAAHLHLAEGLDIPLEAATQTFAILAKRGVGKTHTAVVLVEEMLKAAIQVIVLDPLDVWWGLRSSADGQHQGLPIVVLGGSHADLPLEATAGSLIADLVVEGDLSVVLSLRHLSKSDQRRFVTDFCERLYHRKGEAAHRQPLHLVIDEADSYVPQRVFAGQERMVGAVDDLVRRGRVSGIGVTLISQRASVVNKDVLTQIEVLIALRTVSPQDRKAMESWIEAHDAYNQRVDFMNSLASLPIGTAWVWSPGWLEIFVKVQIRKRETFDSSATPKVGGTLVTPRTLAQVDLAQLRERLAATIEKQKADDPRELRRRIASLEKELQSRVVATSTPAPPEVRIERVEVEVPKPVFEPGQLESLSEAVERLAEVGNALVALAGGIGASVEAARRLSVATPTPAPTSRPASTPAPAQAPAAHRQPKPAPALLQNSADVSSNDGIQPSFHLKAGERKILEVLARRYPLKMTRAQIGTLSGFTTSGGTFQTYFGTLKRVGFVVAEGPGVGEFVITQSGLDYLGQSVPTGPRTTDELQAMWRGSLRAGEARMLDELIRVYPDGLNRVALGDRAGYTSSGGTFSTYLGTLRRNGLVAVAGDGLVTASPTLFLS